MDKKPEDAPPKVKNGVVRLGQWLCLIGTVTSLVAMLGLGAFISVIEQATPENFESIMSLEAWRSLLAALRFVALGAPVVTAIGAILWLVGNRRTKVRFREDKMGRDQKQ